MATESVNSDWVIKESRTHKGTFYRYNAGSGKSEWLTPDSVNNMPLRPMPADTAKAAHNHNHNHAAHNHSHGGQGHNHNHTVPGLNSTTLNSFAISPAKGSGRRPMTRSSRATNVSWGTDDTSEGSECVCTVCECGKHMCPLHGMAKPHPFAGNSRYREDYPRHPLRPNGRDKARHLVQLTPADPDQFKSKYEEDFKPFVPEPPKSMKPLASGPQHVPFEGTTTNREMFHAKPIDKVPSRRPPSPLRVTGPFEGTTTTREAHCGFPGSKPRESMAPHHHTLATVPFEGTTQYKKDYTPHELEQRRKRDLGFAGYDYGPPRDLHTENRDAYTPKPIHYCPVLDLDPKQPSAHTGHIHYTKKERPTFKYFPGRPKTADVHSTTL